MYQSHAAASWPRIVREDTVNGWHLRMVQTRDGRYYIDHFVKCEDGSEDGFTSVFYPLRDSADVAYNSLIRQYQITDRNGKDIWAV